MSTVRGANSNAQVQSEYRGLSQAKTKQKVTNSRTHNTKSKLFAACFAQGRKNRRSKQRTGPNQIPWVFSSRAYPTHCGLISSLRNRTLPLTAWHTLNMAQKQRIHVVVPHCTPNSCVCFNDCLLVAQMSNMCHLTAKSI